MVVPGLASSATAIQNAVTANFGENTTGNGIPGVGILVYGSGAGTWRRVSSLGDVGDGSTGVLSSTVGAMIFNGATYDRSRSVAGATGTTGTGIPAAAILNFDGSNYLRTRDGSNFHSAGRADGTLAVLPTYSDGANEYGLSLDQGNTDAYTPVSNHSFAFVNRSYNGTNWDRPRTNAAAAISATTQPFAKMVANPGEWTISNNGGAGNQSTASKAAGGAGVRHVLRSFIVSAIATVLGTATINIRDGATGAGTVLWTFQMDVPANSSVIAALSGLSIFGTANTAMTIESAAGVANVTVAVNASGYSTI